MKTIATLVEDIQALLTHDGPRQIEDSKYTELGNDLAEIVKTRFEGPARVPRLSPSQYGNPCERKLWYSTNTPEDGEPLPASAVFKFLFGDVIELLLLFLAEGSGHKVEGKQDKVSLHGMDGSRDAVIDGMTIDCKSASTYGFKKFKVHGLDQDDPFGYLPQGSIYTAGAADDPLVENKEEFAFLVADKTLGHICLDTHAADAPTQEEVDDKRAMLEAQEPPRRGFMPVADGKSGNMKLDTVCSYCAFKEKCYPRVRTFVYAQGPRYLTTVNRVPDVPEV